MPLLIDILVWASAHLSPWQRDALRRLFQQRELTNQDIDDLYALLKSARGISDHQNRQPIPLTQAHLPAQLGTRGGPAWLDSMFQFLRGASRCSAYAAVRRAGRLSKYTPSGV